MRGLGGRLGGRRPAVAVYFCFNLVNLAAATAQRLREQPHDRAIVLYEPTRLEAGARPTWAWGRGLAWLPACPFTLLLLLLLCWLGLVRKIYLPHRREGGRLLAAIWWAAQTSCTRCTSRANCSCWSTWPERYELDRALYKEA